MAGLMVVLFYACSKNDLLTHSDADFFLNQNVIGQEELKANEKPFHKAVGAPIDGTLGQRWIENYRKLHKGRIDYFLAMNNLKTILGDSNCVGICMYYAINEKDEQLILPVGINKDGMAMIPVNVDTEDGTINWKTAKQWMANYKGPIKARFFGTNTFIRLMEDPTCQVIKATYAINDGGAPQLLLANAAVSAPSIFQDESRPCPPYCPIAEVNR